MPNAVHRAQCQAAGGAILEDRRIPLFAAGTVEENAVPL
jgi:hypothetical protein